MEKVRLLIIRPCPTILKENGSEWERCALCSSLQLSAPVSGVSPAGCNSFKQISPFYFLCNYSEHCSPLSLIRKGFSWKEGMFLETLRCTGQVKQQKHPKKLMSRPRGRISFFVQKEKHRIIYQGSDADLED